jgi:hypothetical protein
MMHDGLFGGVSAEVGRIRIEALMSWHAATDFEFSYTRFTFTRLCCLCNSDMLALQDSLQSRCLWYVCLPSRPATPFLMISYYTVLDIPL